MTAGADERIARLYGLPPEDFTPERNALAAELHVSGDAEGAALVKALRKPTAAAWAVNQLVRAEPDLVEALLGAGGELRQAHRQAASGRGSEQLRAAAEAERAAVELLVARAPAVLGRPLTPALAESIRNSLRAASSDDDARERVRTGTLVTELRPVGLGPAPAAGASRGKPDPPGAADPSRESGARPRRASSADPRRSAGADPRRASGEGRMRASGADRSRASGADRSRASGADPARASAAERESRAELKRELCAAASEEAALQRALDAAVRALTRAEESCARAREAADAAAEREKDARKRMREARAALAGAQRRRARLERG